MENFNDLKEDTLQNMEDLLKRVSGSERLSIAKELIHCAAFWGTSTQTPVTSLGEAIEIIKTSVVDFHCGCEVQGDLKHYSQN